MALDEKIAGEEAGSSAPVGPSAEAPTEKRPDAAAAPEEAPQEPSARPKKNKTPVPDIIPRSVWLVFAYVSFFAAMTLIFAHFQDEVRFQTAKSFLTFFWGTFCGLLFLFSLYRLKNYELRK